MDVLPQLSPNESTTAEPALLTLTLTPTTETLLKRFDRVLKQTKIKGGRWLRSLMNRVEVPTEMDTSSHADSNTSKLSPTLVMDYIYLRVVKDGNTFGKRDLWAYVLLLNRTNTPRQDARFTRVKHVFSKLISHFVKHDKMALPQNIAELEIIKNYLPLHLNSKENESDLTLTSIESELESAYFQIFSKRGESPPQTWDALWDVLLSRTSFEDIYPPEKVKEGPVTPKFSLFLVKGNPVQLKIPDPVKRPQPWENVIEIRDPGDVREAFVIFMEQFLIHFHDPTLTPRLMRSMILIIVDLVDVAIMYKLDTFPTLFGGIGCWNQMGEPNLWSKALFKLWVWVGVMSNPLHKPEKNGLSVILRLPNILEAFHNENNRAAELTALMQRVTNKSTRPDFHLFLELLDKFYPRRSTKALPYNELEEMYLNIRLDFGFPPSFFFNPHFVKQRLCATSGKYCSRLMSSGDPENERMEVGEICSVCDSSSDEENEGHDDGSPA